IDIVNELTPVGQKDLVFNHLDYDEFPDEPDLRIQRPENIKGKHALIFNSCHNREMLEEFHTLVWAAKHQYGAASVTGIMPFMRYRRQDHAEKIHEINRNRMLIHGLASAGTDRFIVCDIHSKVTLQNCKEFGIKAWNVDPSSVFAAELMPLVEKAREEGREFYIHAPDIGSIPRAVTMAKIISAKVSANPKERLPNGETRIIEDPAELEAIQKQYDIEIIFADEKLAGAEICIREDEVATAGTGNKAAHKLIRLGAYKVHFSGTHPVCAPGWKRKMFDGDPFGLVMFGNTIEHHNSYKYSTGGRVKRMDMSKVIAHQLFEVMKKIK
ncbi:ribose-phosphate pyrophosphokinase-like domain-containing protein, partial [Candidatus Parcubacteria bacterium]|nr:ribose-phosphate pyrophosphokinase-like domain-containing protein [Candidatus Parcubacteria bacterium]